ncbi:2-succinyl-5-enolpyruvyl-6-hydroxy-3-cyclohexene-1-carboxylic-acid synthase [Rubneribacter sp.]
MYTELKSYQIIISLLKQRGIKKCVLSAGSRNVPFVHSVEEDPFFECYSVVDERSAGYFALGLAQESGEPVVVSCTSSTATCNYWPPVAEAFYQGVPLVVLTSDRAPSLVGQLEDQCIDQAGMFDRHVRKSVNLPIVQDADDRWHCERLVNEALLELDHRGTGPVHINVPMKSYNNSFNVRELPKARLINRVMVSDRNGMAELAARLDGARRILVVCGQQAKCDTVLAQALDALWESRNVAIAAEYMANVPRGHAFNPTLCMEYRYITEKKFREFLPDVVVSFGGNMTAGLKEMLRRCAGEYEHWSIEEDGRVCDAYKSLTTVIEGSPAAALAALAQSGPSADARDHEYAQALSDYERSAVVPPQPYNNVLAIQKVVEQIPANSLVHLAINDAIRITNFFNLPEDATVYANVGTHGIDGPLSSFFGQAIASPSRQAFLIVGDLAFFYDMNAMRLRHIGENAHILLINNHGGEEFYYNKMYRNEASDLHTTARHSTKAEGWVREVGFRYLSADDEASFAEALPAFFKPGPVLFEVFTEMSTDAQALYDIYDATRPRDAKSEAIRQGKDFIKATIGQEKAQKFANLLKGGK